MRLWGYEVIRLWGCEVIRLWGYDQLHPSYSNNVNYGTTKRHYHRKNVGFDINYHRKSVGFGENYHRKNVEFPCNYHRKSVFLHLKPRNDTRWRDKALTYLAKYLNILCHLSLDTLPFMLTYFFEVSDTCSFPNFTLKKYPPSWHGQTVVRSIQNTERTATAFSVAVCGCKVLLNTEDYTLIHTNRKRVPRRCGTLFLEPLVGFEPTTPRLQITCSGQLS